MDEGELAAMPGSLVGMKNIGVHKSVALTVHIPEELAVRVIEIFGWPTMTNPISVVVARMAMGPEQEAIANRLNEATKRKRGRPKGSGKNVPLADPNDPDDSPRELE